MTQNAVYWIWLQMVMGVGARTEDVLANYDTAREVYETDSLSRRISGVFTYKQVDKMDRIKLSEAQSIFERCMLLGQTVVTPEDAAYPRRLRTLVDMPLVLYVRGDLSCMVDTLAIAVVGSRNASMYSLDITRRLCRGFARAGAVVVSGAALGVDSAAHTGALYADGRTVGVLGCGLNTTYLMKNAVLREEIVQHGALVTEYPPDTPARASNFPMRNRLISGMSSGVLVIEAGEKSGSLITARCAAEQGRDVFGVPGDLTSVDYTGVNRLIRDGAKPVFSARDVLSEYMWVYDEQSLDDLAQQPRIEKPIEPPQPRIEKPAVRQQPDMDVSADAKAVYRAFEDGPTYADDLVRKTGFEPNRVFTALTELEICGFIKMIEGKRYTIV